MLTRREKSSLEDTVQVPTSGVPEARHPVLL